jgi:hypothetical protein
MPTSDRSRPFAPTPEGIIPFQADPVLASLRGNPGTPSAGRVITLDYKARKYFDDFHRRAQRFAAIVAHRRAGKTVAALMDVIHRALKVSKPDARYAFCGPTHAQIKDVVWIYLKRFTYPLPNTRVNEQELSVTLFNGAVIRLYSLDSSAYDRMRGIYLDGCVIDEYSDCDPRAMTEVIRPALADRLGWLTIIGTAKGRDAFYAAYRKGTKDPLNWFTKVLRASETHILPHSELEHMKRTMGANEYARELECSFEVEGYDQLISGITLEEALHRQVNRDPNQPTTLGVDVARFGDDRTVVVVRQGDRLVDGKAWKGQDLMYTAQQTANLAILYKPRMIFVDGVGVGGGVVDRLRHLGYSNVEDVNVGRRANDDRKYANLRAECYVRMKEWLEERAAIHQNFQLREAFADDCATLNYFFDNKGRLAIEGKDELKSRGLPSPDIADAVALTFAQILPLTDIERLNNRQGYNRGQIAPMIDPFETLDQWEYS